MYIILLQHYLFNSNFFNSGLVYVHILFDKNILEVPSSYHYQPPTNSRIQDFGVIITKDEA